MMKYRRLGRTELRVSEIGFGTCQLRMVPRRQALDTLRRGFELGVNIVHTAADYGNAIDTVAEAVRETRGPVHVCSNGWGTMAQFEAQFEQSRALFGRPGPDGRMRLDLFGIASVEDRLLLGDDVWGNQGQVEFLRRKKEEGILGHAFCTTHGSPEFIAGLIESGHFDAIMFAFNALGHHALSFLPPDDREREDVHGNVRLFDLAARHDVGVLVMEVLAGGLMCRGKAFGDRMLEGDAHAGTRSCVPASVALTELLASQPYAAALMPGTASVEEANENALAGHGIASTATEAFPETIDALRATLCTRCGACEPTCSEGLAISWLFRASDLERTGATPFETPDGHQYFDHHRETDRAVCSDCAARTCQCPIGIDIPAQLVQRHAAMWRLRRLGVAAGPTRIIDTAGAPAWAAELLSRSYGAEALRLSVRNIGSNGWHRDPRFARVRLVARHRSGWTAAVDVVEDVPSNGVFHGAMTLDHPLPLDQIDFVLSVSSSDGDSFQPVLGIREMLNAGVDASPPVDYAVDYIGVEFPKRVRPRSRFGMWFRVRNAGRMPWTIASAHPVVAVLRDIAKEVIASASLPHEVAPGESCDLHLVVPAPAEAGPVQMMFNLVHVGVAAFGDRGAADRQVDLTVDGPPTPDADLFDIASRSNWAFYHPTSGVSMLADGSTLPRFIEQAHGAHVWDSNGRRYVDYTSGWGAALLGHSNEIVESAVRRSLLSGPTLPLPHRTEMELTDALCRTELIPCAEIVAFGKNGSDACTLAVRLARACTGRKTVLVCGYHGWQDWYAEALGFEGTGVPARTPPLVIRVESGRMDLLLAQIDAHRSDLAAVMLEPAGAAGGPRMVTEDIETAALAAAAHATRAAGGLLIFDEIITGFRYRQGSVQKATGVVPDMACFGKALANGFPLSALVGRASVMRELARAFYGPTFKGETHAIAAALAALRIYRTEPVAEHVWDVGRSLQVGLAEAIAGAALPARIAGPPFRFVLHFDGPDPSRQRLMRTLYLQELLRHGIITYAGVMLPGYAHRRDEIDRTVDAAAKALRTVARRAGEGEESLHRAIEVPLLGSEG